MMTVVGVPIIEPRRHETTMMQSNHHYNYRTLQKWSGRKQLVVTVALPCTARIIIAFFIIVSSIQLHSATAGFVIDGEGAATAVSAASNIFHTYEMAAEGDGGLLTDVLTCGFINTVSDSFAQKLAVTIPPSSQPQETTMSSSLPVQIIGADDSYHYDVPRTVRLAIFGLADGVVSHVWFVGLDKIVGDGMGPSDALVKTAADALLYTPLWCAWFLAAFTVLEAFPLVPCLNENKYSIPTTTIAVLLERVRSIPTVWQTDWSNLLQGNLGFFLPITAVIYSAVPRELRVLAFGVASLAYTTILSLWNEERSSTTSVLGVGRLGESDKRVAVETDKEKDIHNDFRRKLQSAAVKIQPSSIGVPFRVLRAVVRVRKRFR